jgi:hypothetical protein
MSEAYGFPNRIISELVGELLNHEDFCKFLYYTNGESSVDILSQSKPKIPNVMKKIYVGTRVNPTQTTSDILTCIRVLSVRPVRQQSEVLKTVDIEVVVMVHKDHLTTAHGTRDIALATSICEALDKKKLGGIGDCQIVGISDLTGLPTDYTGYLVLCRVSGFPKATLGVKNKEVEIQW